jgi:hypothetical protein
MSVRSLWIAGASLGVAVIAALALALWPDSQADKARADGKQLGDALDRAVDGFVGSRTSDDEFSADLYEAELDGAVDDLYDNASGFRGEGPEVQQAFWEGYQSAITN